MRCHCTIGAQVRDVQVPLCARRIASTWSCLFIMSSYDIEEDALYCELPNSSCDDPGPGEEDEEEDEEVAPASEECL